MRPIWTKLWFTAALTCTTATPAAAQDAATLIAACENPAPAANTSDSPGFVYLKMLKFGAAAYSKSIANIFWK